jgi:hypothetical protein
MTVLVLRIEGATGLANRTKVTGNATLTVVLDGTVPQCVVDAVNGGIAKLKQSVISLRDTLPYLRFQDGFWTCVTSANVKFRVTVLTEAFITPLSILGFYVTGAVGWLISWSRALRKYSCDDFRFCFVFVCSACRKLAARAFGDE